MTRRFQIPGLPEPARRKATRTLVHMPHGWTVGPVTAEQAVDGTTWTLVLCDQNRRQAGAFAVFCTIAELEVADFGLIE